MTKCNSCTKGLNGRNGNVYQPCGCVKHRKTRQGDEWFCSKCRIRWAIDEPEPEKCIKAKPPKLL